MGGIPLARNNQAFLARSEPSPTRQMLRSTGYRQPPLPFLLPSCTRALLAGAHTPMYSTLLWTLCNMWLWLLNLYDLGLYVGWLEILGDFTDYRDYGNIRTRIWSLRWLFLYLCFYNLVSFVTTVSSFYLPIGFGVSDWCIIDVDTAIFCPTSELGDRERRA
jgi:hypothetical protein